MGAPPQTILYFGDQTDPYIDGIDRLYKQAATTPWLEKFLNDIARVFREETKGLDPAMHDRLGDFSSLLELTDRYRHVTDEMGIAHSLLLHAVRAATLLQ